MPIDYQLIVEQSISRLADLVRQRRRLDSEITRLQGFLRSMVYRVRKPDFSEPVALDDTGLGGDQLGITKAVAQILQTYRVCLTPVLIRDLLPCVGFDTTRYKDPLTSIHVILKRLTMSGHVVRHESPEGHGYSWTSEPLGVNRVASTHKFTAERSELGPEAI